VFATSKSESPMVRVSSLSLAPSLALSLTHTLSLPPSLSLSHPLPLSLGTSKMPSPMVRVSVAEDASQAPEATRPPEGVVEMYSSSDMVPVPEKDGRSRVMTSGDERDMAGVMPMISAVACG